MIFNQLSPHPVAAAFQGVAEDAVAATASEDVSASDTYWRLTYIHTLSEKKKESEEAVVDSEELKPRDSNSSRPNAWQTSDTYENARK